jgi:RNA polymerase primary sigma factor
MNLSVIDSLKNDIDNNPLLTKEEECNLSEQIKLGNKQAREKLIASNYRLAVSIAKKYHRDSIPLSDLIQESCIGLVKAVDKFDHTLGYKFSTYACWWIKQACLQYINEHASTMKVPTHSRLLSLKINKLKEDYKNRLGQLPTEEEISEALGVTVNAVKNSSQTNARYLNIDKSSSDNDDDRSLGEKIDSLEETPEESYLNKELMSIIKKNLSSLSPREEIVIRLRFGLRESIYSQGEFPKYRSK